MKENKFPVRRAIGIGVLIIVIGIAVGVVSLYTSPLGPSLETSDHPTYAVSDLLEPTHEPVSVAAQSGLGTTPTTGAEKPAAADPATVTPEKVTVAPPEDTASEVCGETTVWNVLIVGSDAADLYYPQGSDLTRILRVDFPNKTVSTFAFSRDLWVDASHLNLEDPDIASIKLGMVFYEARQRSTKIDPKDTMLDGVNAIASTLVRNFTTQSDYYIALDLDKFPAMIDTLGGIPINIPASLKDPMSGMVFSAGQQTLNGIQTAIYARAFISDDLSRIDRDNLVVLALRHKMLEPAIWVKIPELLLKYHDAILTDLSPQQVNHLACLMKEIEVETIIQEGVEEEWTSPGPEGSLLWDKTEVFNRLRELGIIP